MVISKKKKDINPLTQKPVGFDSAKGGYINPLTQKPVGFDSAKGGFQAEAAFYPTKNPDFVPPKPSPTTATQTYSGNFIRQGKEGNIVTTPAEEKAIGGAGAQTDKVKQLQQIISDKITADDAIRKLHEQNIGTQAIEEEAGKMEVKPTEEQMQQAAQPTANLINQGAATPVEEAPRPLNAVEKIIGAPTPLSVGEVKKEAANVGLGIVKFAAQVYDFTQSLFNEGKSINQKEAERTFGGLQGDVTQDLNLINQGYDLDLDSTRKKIELMEAANNRLIESAKGRGKLNLRYWLTDGIDVETFGYTNVETIKQLKLRLGEAQRTSSLKQAKSLI